MPNITTYPEFHTESAERGHERILAQAPDVELIIDAIDKMSRRQRAADDARRDERSELITDHSETKRLIAILEADWQSGRAQDDRSVKNHERLTAKAAKLNAKIEALDAHRAESNFHFTSLQKFFATVGELQRFETVEIDVPEDKAEALAMLEECRADRLELLRKRRDAEIGPLPLEVALNKARDEIRKIASEGVPNVSALFRMPKDIANRRKQGTLRFQEKMKPGQIDGWEPDVWPFIFWACQETIAAKVESMLRAEAELHSNALGFDERAAVIASLDSKIIEAEYLESALVRSLGKNAQHRHDANPLAVLLLRRLPDAPAPKQAPIYYGGGSEATIGARLTPEQATATVVGTHSGVGGVVVPRGNRV